MPLDNGKTGYGCPPQKSRFQKGQSGNPSGRPKGSKSFLTALDESLAQEIIITEGAKKKKLAKRDVIARQLVNKSVSGDSKTISILLSQIKELEKRLDTTHSFPTLSDADRCVISTVYKRIKKIQGG